MRRGVAIRSGGYVALLGGFWALCLVLSVGAYLDPTLEDARDADWMFWLGAACLAGVLARAPFVGLIVRDGRVTRRSWVRSQSWAAGDIAGVAVVGYSGNLNWFSRSGLFLMIVLRTHGGAVIEVPEVSGVPHKMDERLHHLARALRLPAPSDPGAHRR